MIDKLSLNTALEEWNFWQKPFPKSILREQEGSPINAWDAEHALVLTGVRRCGKSTLMRQLMETLSKRIGPEQLLFVNFEDPRLAEDLNFKLLDLCVEVHREMRCPDKPIYLFFDEIQVVAGWERWVRTQLEQQKKLFFCLSGSNASLLSGEMATTLTGRHHSFEITPFSFREFVSAHPHPSKNRQYHLAQYLKTGGFPAIVCKKVTQPEETLRQYFDDILLRDIERRIGSRTGHLLRQIAHMLMDAVGSEQSLTRLSRITDIAVETIREFVAAYAQAFLLFEVSYFSYSVRQKGTRNKKYYPVDMALRRSVLPERGKDFGKDAETAVYLELRRQGKEISYWRQKQEVDFVISQGKKILPIQVTMTNEAPLLAKKEAALQEFFTSFSFAKALMIVPDVPFEKKSDNFTIQYVPIGEFLSHAGKYLADP